MELVRSGEDSNGDVFPRECLEHLLQQKIPDYVTQLFSRKLVAIVGTVDRLVAREVEDGELAIDAEVALCPAGVLLADAGWELALGALIVEADEAQPDGSRVIRQMQLEQISLVRDKVK